MLAAPKPGQAKARGKKVTLRPDWNEKRVDVMRELLREKFRDPDLRAALDATGDADLQEGNIWNDTFWGVSLKTGKGRNNLGKLLMEIRAENRAGGNAPGAAPAAERAAANAAPPLNRLTNMSGAEKEAADAYEYTSVDINTEAGRPGSTDEQTRQHVAALDSAMEKSKLQQPIITYRGVDNLAAVFGRHENMVGAEATNLAFSSTTTNPGAAAQFFVAGGMASARPASLAHESAVLRLNVPAGVGAITITGEGNGGIGEVLLQRGLKLRVVADLGESEFPEIYSNRMRRARLLDVEVVPVDTPARDAVKPVEQLRREGWGQKVADRIAPQQRTEPDQPRRSAAYNLVMGQVERSGGFPQEAQTRIARVLARQEELVGDKMARIIEIKSGITHHYISNRASDRDRLTALTAGGKVHINPKLWEEDAARTAKRRSSNHKVSGGDSSFEATIAHEIGHALTQQHLTKKQLGDLAERAGRVLGLDMRTLPAAKDRNAWSIDQWFKQPKNRAIVERKVSRYGASKFDELIGEVWGEYSTSPNPSREIREIGEFLRELIRAS